MVGIRNHSQFIDVNLSEAIERFEKYDAHQLRMKHISAKKRPTNDISPFPKSYAMRTKEVQKRDKFMDCRAK